MIKLLSKVILRVLRLRVGCRIVGRGLVVSSVVGRLSVCGLSFVVLSGKVVFSAVSLLQLVRGLLGHLGRGGKVLAHAEERIAAIRLVKRVARSQLQRRARFGREAQSSFLATRHRAGQSKRKSHSLRTNNECISFRSSLAQRDTPTNDMMRQYII